ncbi:uncharacterized protein BDW43DRAFT_297063 [Aspergillus alliaceus]|uniref:uncharacterized protein n=1 Tax=Petromyces alliaceus TaxID=209559 RepID=UPI0012A52BC9|nr:uncharacterized protein BDW43DRAFT_297063 [Aspergillus alliaceus]KAB8238122.1 hypothetical protein BDW43DRAFT_297063 [Aspergillus alliaceus]
MHPACTDADYRSDAAALLLASTHPGADLPDVNINYPSTYSALAVYNILGYNGQSHRPGEYPSEVAYNWKEHATLRWKDVRNSWKPVDATTASIGLLTMYLSQLLLSLGEVRELVIMSGAHPCGHEYNFYGYNATATAHVVNTWPQPMTFSGTELGEMVYSGARLTGEGPAHDPVNAAYRWYNGYNATHYPWDPLTVLYAIEDLGDTFEFGTDGVYNYIYLYGRNEWQSCGIASASFQHYLKLAIPGEALGAILDEAYLQGARMAAQHDKQWQNKCIYCKVGLVFNKET